MMGRSRARTAIVLGLLLPALDVFTSAGATGSVPLAAVGGVGVPSGRRAATGGPDPTGEAVTSPGIEVLTHSAYWLDLRGAGENGFESRVPAMLVIRGEIRNQSAGPLHHVKLSYELLDGEGRVVVSEEGYNRRAETLKPLDARARSVVGNEAGATPVATHASDTFRMLFLAADVPPFDRYRVRVVEVLPED